MHQDGGVITTIDVTVAKVLIVLIMTILHMNRFNNSNIIKIKLQQVKNWEAEDLGLELGIGLETGMAFLQALANLIPNPAHHLFISISLTQQMKPRGWMDNVDVLHEAANWVERGKIRHWKKVETNN